MEDEGGGKRTEGEGEGICPCVGTKDCVWIDRAHAHGKGRLIEEKREAHVRTRRFILIGHVNSVS